MIKSCLTSDQSFVDIFSRYKKIEKYWKLKNSLIYSQYQEKQDFVWKSQKSF